MMKLKLKQRNKNVKFTKPEESPLLKPPKGRKRGGRLIEGMPPGVKAEDEKTYEPPSAMCRPARGPYWL
jgi:hypothetical protein